MIFSVRLNLKNKIIEEINPKNIEGKIFDGKSLAFFLQNFCEMHNNSGDPNFDNLFDKLIKISTSYSEDNIIVESYKQMQNL